MLECKIPPQAVRSSFVNPPKHHAAVFQFGSVRNLYDNLDESICEIQGETESSDKNKIIRQIYRGNIMREKQRAIQQFREESLNFEEDSTNKSFFVNLISFINTRLNRIKENPITIDDKVALKKRHEQITNNLQSLNYFSKIYHD